MAGLKYRQIAGEENVSLDDEIWAIRHEHRWELSVILRLFKIKIILYFI